jgi:competence ComEA-like helix-hairpin-helix protein
MDFQERQTKVLISTGLILSSAIIFYNVFFSNQADGPNVICIDKNKVQTAHNTIALEDVPSTKEFEQGSADFDPKDEKIDINSAGTSDFEKLPGIGSQIAQRIVEYREINGPFNDIYELKNIKGISDKKFEKIQDFLELKN